LQGFIILLDNLFFVNCFCGFTKILLNLSAPLAQAERLWYNSSMKPDLSGFAGMNICVAVSGGRDSMALLHYLKTHAKEYSLRLSAVNCDHGIRGAASERDSAFVAEWCRQNEVPLYSFKADCLNLSKTRRISVETAARDWRLFCFFRASEEADGAYIATAHHLGDNAETVLFNIARGSALSGASGLRDGKIRLHAKIKDNKPYAPWECDGERTCTVEFSVIRPLINISRAEIDEYVKENGVPYVDDMTNFTGEYTRNKLRLNVLPELEKSVPGAYENIFRFSRLAYLSDEYIQREAFRKVAMSLDGNDALIARCDEYVLFARCAVYAVKQWHNRKDYTLSHIDALYNLQYAESGKRYEFLGLTAYSENGRIAICEKPKNLSVPFEIKSQTFLGRLLTITKDCAELPLKNKDGEIIHLESADRFYTTAEGDKFGCKFALLKFDLDKIPPDAVIRTRREGDRFGKFGGGTKSLGDFLTDKKIPVRLRDEIPIIACGSEVLAVCGVEISDKIKITPSTAEVGFITYGAII